MLLRAIHRIQAGDRGEFMPGDIFASESEKEAERLIRLGAAEPARRKVVFEAGVQDDGKGGK